MSRLRPIALLALAVVGAWPGAQAAPCPVVTLVAPFPAGSTTDTIARALAQGMGTHLNTTVVVENKPGAEGLIAAQDVLRSKADGCRLLFATSGNLSIAPHIRREPPYDATRDFTAIADVGRYTYLLYTSTELPAQTYAQFVEQARAAPGRYHYGTGSYTNVLAFAHLAQQDRFEMTRVPFRGEPPAIQEMLAGRVQAMVATTLGIPHVKQGRLRALAVLAPARTPLLPQVPTLAELGVAPLDIVPWAGLVGPAGLPEPIRARLHEAANAALTSPSAHTAASAAGFALTPSSQADFARLVATQDAVYRQKIRALGLTEN